MDDYDAQSSADLAPNLTLARCDFSTSSCSHRFMCVYQRGHACACSGHQALDFFRQEAEPGYEAN